MLRRPCLIMQEVLQRGKDAGMNSILRDIFRAIHEGRWLKIEYKNKNEQKTNYWIGIQDLDVARRRLTVDGLHLGMYTVTTLFVYIDSILSSEIV